LWPSKTNIVGETFFSLLVDKANIIGEFTEGRSGTSVSQIRKLYNFNVQNAEVMINEIKLCVF